jgi:citrate lyase beta subunit
MTGSDSRPTESNRVTIRQSLLSVLASNEKMVENALTSDADAVVLDLEDSVAPGSKAEARVDVVRAIRELDWRGRPTTYRVNALDTPFFYNDLIEVVEGPVKGSTPS